MSKTQLYMGGKYPMPPLKKIIELNENFLVRLIFKVFFKIYHKIILTFENKYY